MLATVKVLATLIGVQTLVHGVVVVLSTRIRLNVYASLLDHTILLLASAFLCGPMGLLVALGV